jgi:hypothetical protein
MCRPPKEKMARGESGMDQTGLLEMMNHILQHQPIQILEREVNTPLEMTIGRRRRFSVDAFLDHLDWTMSDDVLGANVDQMQLPHANIVQHILHGRRVIDGDDFYDDDDVTNDSNSNYDHDHVMEEGSWFSGDADEGEDEDLYYGDFYDPDVDQLSDVTSSDEGESDHNQPHQATPQSHTS